MQTQRISLPPADRADVWETIRTLHRPLFVYGMGNGADKLLARLENYGVAVDGIVASDGFVRGQSFHGFTVQSFFSVFSLYKDPVFLLSFGSRREDVISFVQSLCEKATVIVPDMPVAGDSYFDAAFYRAHFEEIREVYEAFADDVSKDTYASFLRAKLFGTWEDLMACTCEKNDIYALLQEARHAVDLGAYTGDTLKECISYLPHVFDAVAVEPDEKTFRKLSAFAETAPFPIRAVHGAAWREAGIGYLHASANRNTSLNGASHQHTDTEVPLVCVDDLCKGSAVDYIKMDVEGAEREALAGAEQTILREMPMLRVALYHRAEDIFALPLWVAKRCPGYRLYMRRTKCFPAWEADLIALPERK